MADWLEEFHDAFADLLDAANAFPHIIGALEVLGMDRPAEELHEARMMIRAVHSKLTKTLSRHLNESLAESKRGVGLALAVGLKHAGVPLEESELREAGIIPPQEESE